ncbi:hypothetical protein [Sandarakinorhabdus oryzae]|uniref:hypothetical protein n=1 Tax=Sandarakinorhabdus oryzae TaxID=2675220 RepID=UPI0012E0CCDB|nr:hypothetical protein [Sandarakinorhabdus oryzae]
MARPFPAPVRLAALIGIALLAAMPAAAGDPRYDQGKAEWLARSYPPARSTLLDYRRAGFGRTAEVDYMLGTSGCRIAEQRAWGARVLASILYRYQLNPASRDLVGRERLLCLGTAAMPELSGAPARTALAVTAGAMARGKMYYLANGNEPVAAYAARSLGPIDPEALARRVAPVGEGERLRAELLRIAPERAQVAIKGRFAFVTTSGQSDAQLTAMAARLETYLAFLEREYGAVLPGNFVTLWLVPDQWQLREAARKLHNLDVSPATIGYTFQDDQSAVALIPGTQIGTLFHELFHLVVRSGFGDVPQWLDEGIAGLYEVSQVEGDRVVGLRNWRGPVLARLWSKRPTLQAMISAPWYVSDTPGNQMEYDGPPPSTEAVTAQFATARYFALWLQGQGRLKPVYARVQALQPGDDDDPAGAVLKAVEAELGPIAAVQTQFERWFLAQEKLPVPPPKADAVTKYEPNAQQVAPPNQAPPPRH